MSFRYAIYFSPAVQSPWWTFGATWLGRDEASDAVLPQPRLDTVPALELHRLTMEPRRYGFHATLKAPFRLAPGNDETGLIRRIQNLATTLSPLPLGVMRAAQLDNFVALVPEAVSPDLNALASTCMTALDDLRAPLSEADLTRRQANNLDARGQELLALYGYPHTLERFRFHMTLTGPVTLPEAQAVSQAVAGDIERLNAVEPLVLDRICLFAEEASGAPFRRIADIALGKP